MKNLFLILFTIITLSVRNSHGQWFQAGQIPQSEFNYSPNISVADSNVLFVASNTSNIQPYIYRSVNGGQNWTAIPTNSFTGFLHNISAKDSLTLFCTEGGTNNPKLRKTTNAGLTWVTIDVISGTQVYFEDIVFSKSNPQCGVIIADQPGGLFYLYKTTNSGDNWSRTSHSYSGSYPAFGSAFIIDENFFGFLIDRGNNTNNPYLTSNGGTSWYNGNTITPGSFGGIAFNDNKINGVMTSGIYLPLVKISSDGGNNWADLNTNTTNTDYNTPIWITGTNTVFINSELGVQRSDNNGINWTQQFNSTDSLVRFDYAKKGNNVICYSVSNNGKIFKSRQTVTTGIQNISTEISSDYSLSQNYPNPFNPVTKINYELRVTNYVSLKIYDIKGKEIETLINRKQTAGSYDINFDAGNLPSGVYFYKLVVSSSNQTAGEFSETKKMSLIK
ncbi:MAG: T9SS type A sorting domain-containing protein [Ignavibacteria bacterium]